MGRDLEEKFSIHPVNIPKEFPKLAKDEDPEPSTPSSEEDLYAIFVMN
jgi:hypothetical protein